MGVALALACACASTDPAKGGARRLRELAASHVGPAAAVVAIEAETTQAAWGRVVRARTEKPLEESRLLAQLFDAREAEPLEVVAGGPFAPLNEQVLLDAFALAEARDLAALRLVIVGPKSPSQALTDACSERRARCEHVAWPTRSD